MAKLTKFQRSQKAHLRLHNKYQKQMKKWGDKNHRLASYHYCVLCEQDKVGSMIGDKRKRMWYKHYVKDGQVL